MAESQAFDPIHALDGWRVPTPVPPELALQPLPMVGGLGRAVEPDGFDPIHALDDWHAPAPPPLELDLGTLRTGGSWPDRAKRARLKARGYEMVDVEDIELPELPPSFALVKVSAPVVPSPSAPTGPEPEPVRPIEDVELPSVATPPAVAETPVLNRPVETQRPQSDPRLLDRWQPQAWTALARRIGGATAEVVQTSSGPQIAERASQWLCALWPPQGPEAPLLGRWPELAALVGAETAFGALHQLLPELPPEACLWPADIETDWVLVANLVLRQDGDLRPAQAHALRSLAESERGATSARMGAGYDGRGGVMRRRA